MKTTNQYADKFPCYEETPKAVAAALAFSLAMRLCDDNVIDAREMVRTEWETLFANGIVPQSLPPVTRSRVAAISASPNPPPFYQPGRVACHSLPLAPAIL